MALKRTAAVTLLLGFAGLLLLIECYVTWVMNQPYHVVVSLRLEGKGGAEKFISAYQSQLEVEGATVVNTQIEVPQPGTTRVGIGIITDRQAVLGAQRVEYHWRLRVAGVLVLLALYSFLLVIVPLAWLLDTMDSTAIRT